MTKYSKKFTPTHSHDYYAETTSIKRHKTKFKGPGKCVPCPIYRMYLVQTPLRCYNQEINHHITY